MTAKNQTVFILSFSLIALFYIAMAIEGFVGVCLLIIAIGFAIGIICIVLFNGISKIRNPNNNILWSTLIGIGALCVVIFRPIEFLIEKLKSPIVFYGQCEHTVTMTSLVLRENQSFEYNAGGFLSNEMYYGTYKVNGDTLSLQFDSEEIPLSDKLIHIKDGLIEFKNTEHNHGFKESQNLLWK
jgi:hypothetical protein